MATRTVNKVILLGRVGKDAETSTTPSGIAISKFSIATSRRWKDTASGEWKEETDWHNIVLWRQEKVAAYIVKGTQLYLEGRLQTRNYEKDGQRRYVTEVIADEVILLGGKQGAAGDAAVAPAATSGTEITDDDIPF